jgi:hypothetical protein
MKHVQFMVRNNFIRSLCEYKDCNLILKGHH